MTVGEMSESPAPGMLKRILDGEYPSDAEVGKPPDDLHWMVWRGFLPPLIKMERPGAVSAWWESYVATYLERDLRQLSQIDSLPDFRRVMNALALRSANVPNQSEVARDVGISQPTMHRYLNLLETTCLISRLPAFAVNRTKRLVKSPKVMWTDPGLAAFLAGFFDADSLRGSREAGALFESMVYLHLSSLAQLLVPRPRLHYWRTTLGQEVDFVLEWGRKLLAIEVKMGETPKYSDTKSLRTFVDEYPEVSACVVLHTGSRIMRMGERVLAMPWHVLLGS
jgi:predicted AAA+ superfamily ATPase